MSKWARELRHWWARIDLWWAGQKRHEQEQRQRNDERAAANLAARQEHEAKLAAGEVALPKGWHQHPNDPPGFQRWWDGTRWTEHTQQSPTAQRVQSRNQSSGLVLAGWITFVIGLVAWPVFLATLVLGIIVATKPGRGGMGALLIVASLLGPILSLAGCAALLTSGGS